MVLGNTLLPCTTSPITCNKSCRYYAVVPLFLYLSYLYISLIQILQLHTASLALTQILHLTHSHSNPPPHCITDIHSNHPASFTRIPSTVCCAGPNVDAIATAVASAMAEQKRGSPLFIDVEPYHLDPSLSSNSPLTIQWHFSPSYLEKQINLLQ